MVNVSICAAIERLIEANFGKNLRIPYAIQTLDLFMEYIGDLASLKTPLQKAMKIETWRELA